MNKYNSWFGYGIKTGASFIIAGVEGMSGKFFNLGDLSSGSFSMLSARVGPGLGAGIGLCAVFAFNTQNLWNLHNKTTKDVSMNFSIGGKWLEFVKLLKHGKHADTLIEITKVISKSQSLKAVHAENIRNVGSALYTNYDLHANSGERFVAIDIPGAGVGLEMSFNCMQAKLEIGV